MKPLTVLLASATALGTLLAEPPAPYAFDTTKVSGWQGNPADWSIAAGVEASATEKAWTSVTPGTGLLLNGSAGKAHDLVSEFQHGDVEAEIEFVYPKGSNSGVYFQNRYEIQILDSFGKPDDKLGPGDLGGIYQRWDESRKPKGFEGTKPSRNAAKPPGAWQTLHVIFRAPKFAPDGTKTANAKFELVELNGIAIHRDVEVTGPTRGGLPTETAKGPIRLQGDHGPIAFRKLVFKPL
jgi:hypothetical protein